MTNIVLQSLFISKAYECIGTASRRNRFRIILLQFPEYPLLDTREQRCPTLSMEFTSR
jgi:hypothetical protein